MTVTMQVGLRAVLAMSLLVVSPAAQGTPADEAEAAFNGFVEARRSGDKAALERLTHPQFVQHHAYGLVETRDIWMKDGFRAPAEAAFEFAERGVSMRVSGTTAVRDSIVRIRRPKRGIDSWVRSLAVLSKSDRGWQVIELDSAMLHEGSILPDTPLNLPDGMFVSQQGGSFSLREYQGHPTLFWTDGRTLPLVPLGPDRFASGYGSTLTVERDPSGKPTAVSRRFGDRLAWRALPVVASKD